MKNKKLSWKLNKKGDKIISVYWFVILFIVVAAVVYMAYLFYGTPYDARAVEARVLKNKIADCLSEGGYLKEKVLTENFKDNFLEKCDLNLNVEDAYGWEDDQYYIKVSFYEFDNDFSGNLGNLIEEIEVGNINLVSYAIQEQKEKSKKDEMDTIVIHYTEGFSARGAIETIKDNNLSVHYMIDRDGTIISKENADNFLEGGEKAFVGEDERGAHAGCYDIRKGEERRKCTEEDFENLNSINNSCDLFDLNEEEKCCIPSFNTHSIGIELVNLGSKCNEETVLTENYCEDNEVEICGKKWENFTAEQISSLMNLASEIASRNKIPIDREHIIGHDEIAFGFKSDPGPAFPWKSFIENLKIRETLTPNLERSFYVLDKNTNEKYVIKILTIVRKTEKNA